MRNSFQLVGLDPAPFQALFDLSDEQLLAHAAQRRFADEYPGYRCRVSLEEERGMDLIPILVARDRMAARRNQSSRPRRR